MKNNFDKIDESLEIKATITAKEIIKESKKEIRSIQREMNAIDKTLMEDD
jgi:hypothetical protein